MDPKLQAVIEAMLRKKFPPPPMPTDPLTGMHRSPLPPPRPPEQAPWQARLSSDQFNLSLPAPRGAQFGAYVDFDKSPFKLLGGGIRYKQEF